MCYKKLFWSLKLDIVSGVRNLYLRFDGFVTSYEARERNLEFGEGTAILVANSIATGVSLKKIMEN